MIKRNTTRLPGQDCLQPNFTRPGKWLLCAGVFTCTATLTFWPQGLSLFQYERAALASGELWRILSAHFVHLNAIHFALNGVGLLLICELLWNQLPLRHGIGLLVVGILIITAGLWFWHPAIGWYAGFSGVLHTLWAGCALTSLLIPYERTQVNATAKRCSTRLPAYLVAGSGGMLLLLLKLGYEFFYGASMHAATMIGAPVITPAHFYGALAGGCYVAVWWLFRRESHHDTLDVLD